MDSLISFKAGRCDLEGKTVKPVADPGFLFLYVEEDMLHFCWRAFASRAREPEIDLIMFPGDCTFQPYLGSGVSSEGSGDKVSPTNGRIFELKFSSSSQRFYFWLQSKSQHPSGNPSWFSKRDLLIGHVVDEILADNEEEWRRGLAQLRRGGDGSDPPPGGDDDAMEDVQGGESETREFAGGAGPNATGGDFREEGEDSRREGSDGGRAATDDASAVVQNFLRSLKGSNLQAGGQESSLDKPFGSLSDLFSTQDTVSFVKSASPAEVDRLCSHLPTCIFLLSQESSSSLASTEATPEAAQAAIEALSTEQKREILERVLRSPQLHQSLGSLTVALRDGGLPQIGAALGLEPENGGLIRGGSMPVGGGEAVERFLESVKRKAEEAEKK